MSRGRWLEMLAERRAAGQAGGLRARLLERLGERAAAADGMPALHGIAQSGAFPLPPGARVSPDIAYGPDPAQRYDLYLPPAAAAPIFVMVHGGGWSRGDKALWRNVRNKVAHWVGRGYALASFNYRMLPQAAPLQQADDVARALAHVQANADSWGGDAGRMVLVGHSSGAHLACLVACDPAIAERAGAAPCAGTVAIDSAAFDVAALMRGPYAGLYERVFGADADAWREASPLDRLQGALAAPMLAVCSSRRVESPAQAHAFGARAGALGGRVEVLELDLSHAELNDYLGLPGPYTDAVVAFMRSIGLP